MLKNLIILLLFLSTSLSFSQSAKRYKGESFSSAKKRNTKKRYNSVQTYVSAHTAARSYADLNYKDLYRFDSYDELNYAFKTIRNARYLQDPQFSNLKRRSSWMYPDDGCWIRAELMAYNSEHLLKLKLNKVFIFGTLRTKTAFHPNKTVRWWYHVALIAKVNNQPYIIDPSIENKRPLTLEEWMIRQNSDLNAPRLSICKAHTYNESSSCRSPEPRPFKAVKKSLSRYLKYERSRLEQMGFNSHALLGKNPPWR